MINPSIPEAVSVLSPKELALIRMFARALKNNATTKMIITVNFIYLSQEFDYCFLVISP
ncbi:hypothetical protein LEP1GSC192_3366 [Leptospira sp. B5-022]|nr:hypothetical protein LEP1GSC192_3366 [Leptospira sp. B5-022]